MNARVVAWGAGGVAVAIAAVWSGGGEGVAALHAQDANPAPGVTGPTCILKGSHPVTKGTQIFDAPAGGRAIANFTGAFVTMQMSDFPADPTVGRARLSTSGVRIDGYVPISSVNTFTQRDVSVSSGHLWISSAQKVKLVRAAAGSLTAELVIAGSQNQAVRATAPCDAFSLTKGTPTAMEIAGSARGYLMKTTTLDLYEASGGDAFFTLKMNEGTGQLFWSTESKNGFVHVVSRGDVTIDAWARWRDLEALKKGELLDQLIPPSSAVTGAQLTLDKPPAIVKATKEIPIRVRRDEKEKPIGVIEVDAEVYVLETITGWTNVLPKGLGITPPDDGGFWIPSGEVPK
jgi:hypothetical protein